jgi:hypothetical protein
MAKYSERNSAPGPHSLPMDWVMLLFLGAHLVKNRFFLWHSCGTLVQTNLDHWLDAVDPAWAGEDRLLLSSVERRNAAMELCVSLSRTTARPRDAMKRI